MAIKAGSGKVIKDEVSGDDSSSLAGVDKVEEDGLVVVLFTAEVFDRVKLMSDEYGATPSETMSYALEALREKMDRLIKEKEAKDGTGSR